MHDVARAPSASRAPSTKDSPRAAPLNPGWTHFTQQTPIQRAASDRSPARSVAVEAPDSPYEREADQVATAILRSPEPGSPPSITPLRAPSLLRQHKDDEHVQRSASDSRAVDAKSLPALDAGRPLNATTLDFMEPRFGHDFGDVRVHTNPSAEQSARDLNAHAYTTGHDIVFGAGRYQPETDGGRQLLAHELTHVIQQQHDSIGAQRLMRADDGKGDASANNNTPRQKTNTIKPEKTVTRGILRSPDKEGKWELFIPSLTLPDKPGLKEAFRDKHEKPFVLGKHETRTDQGKIWLDSIKPSDTFKTKLASLLSEENRLPGEQTPHYALKPIRAEKSYIIGTAGDDLQNKLRRPWWNRNGEPTLLDVDHILEIQLGGAASDIKNYQLFEHSANLSSGSRIRNAIEKTISQALPPTVEGISSVPDLLVKLPARRRNKGEAATNTNSVESAPPIPEREPKHETMSSFGKPLKPPDPRTVALNSIIQNYHVTFGEVNFIGTLAGKPDIIWFPDQVMKGEHLDSLEPATKTNASDLFIGERLRLFPRPGSGRLCMAELIGAADKMQTFTAKENSWGMELTNGTFNASAPTGSHCGTVDLAIPGSKNTIIPPTQLSLERGGGSTFCHIKPGAIKREFFSRIRAKLLSPIIFPEIDLDDNGKLTGIGSLTIDGIPFLAGLTIDVALVGSDLVFSKTFDVDDIDIPGPVEIDSCSLTLSADTSADIAAQGDIAFHIGELATGSVKAHIGTDGFGLSGELTFDEKLFTGSGRMGYDCDNGFSASGQLAVKPGALKGVKKANFTLGYDQSKQAVDFAGQAELAIPGFKSAAVSAHADEAGNIRLAGEARASDEIPRIKSGVLRIAAERKDDAWSLTGGGELVPDLSGLDASAKISLDYKDGRLTGKLRADYRRSMVAGAVELNAEAGVGEDEEQPLTVWGGGALEVTAAPWLKATVDLVVDKRGEVTIGGELSIPGSLEIFPRKSVEKKLLAIATQIPIVPGVVAEIGGNLTAEAGIGPGSLDQLRLGITYNPDHEENTHITGDAHVSVPSDASVRLGARAGLGLGVTGISATGGLDIGGSLGIVGAAEASAHVDWLPKRGLQIDAEGYIHAQPRFVFDIKGYVNVQALNISFYDRTWDLTSVEIGSDFRLGVRFPLHYQEGKPFNVSLDDMTFEVPDIDTDKLLDEVGAEVFKPTR